METLPESSQPPTRSRRWRVLYALVLVLGPMLLFVSLAFFAVASGYLAEVDPSQITYGTVSGARSIDLGWVVMVGLSVAGMVACAGLPTSRHEPGAVGGAIGQVLGGVVVVGVTLLGYAFSSAFYFTGEGDRCLYASCWPLREQTAALAAPTLIAGTLMVLAALLVRRWRWWVRAVGPAVVWVVLLLMQRILWSPWLLPIFERPPS